MQKILVGVRFERYCKKFILVLMQNSFYGSFVSAYLTILRKFKVKSVQIDILQTLRREVTEFEITNGKV
jgi:hypothetical protein